MTSQTTAALGLAATHPAILPYAEALRDIEAMRDALPAAGTAFRRDARAMLARQAMERAVEAAQTALSEAIEREIPTYECPVGSFAPGELDRMTAEILAGTYVPADYKEG